MQKTSVCAVLVSIFVIAGCATPIPKADKLSASELSTFFERASSEKATLYFGCGTWKTESWLAKTTNELPACAFEVNGKPYKLIPKDGVGRLDVTPGLITLQALPGDSLASYVPLQVDLKPGEMAFVTQNLLHKLGALGGALSGAFVYSLEWTKEGVLERARGKQPVKIQN